MTRRLNDVFTYKVKGKEGTYLVTIAGVKNDCNGNPRYKAIITKMGREYLSAVYTFTGHLNYRESAECKYIVSVYEQGL